MTAHAGEDRRPHLHWDMGSPRPHPHWDMGLIAATSAPGLGSPQPHLRGDWGLPLQADAWLVGLDRDPSHLEAFYTAHANTRALGAHFACLLE